VRVKKESVIEAIGRMARRCETLLIEGAGGLLTPLGEGFTLLDLMVEIPGSVVVAARNRLGVLNHVALTLAKLNDAVIQRTIVVLMGIRQSSLATQTNPDVLMYLIGNQLVECIPFLGSRLKRRMEFLAAHKKSKIVLARILVGL
jgi:dethiobiotin synthetase